MKIEPTLYLFNLVKMVKSNQINHTLVIKKDK